MSNINNKETLEVGSIEFEIDGDKLLLDDFSSQIIPKGNKILVKKLKSILQEYTKKSLIIVANSSESTENRYTIGKILSVGDKVVGFEKGQYVLYGKWAGIDINTHDEKYSVIKDEEVSTVINFKSRTK